MSEPASTDRPLPAARWRAVVAVGCVALALLVATAIYFSVIGGASQTHPKAPDSGQELAEAVGSASPADQDKRFRSLVVGTWQDEYEGKRTMTLKEDGTGTMVVELSGIKALLSAPRLLFDMTWTVENGRLQKQTVGGEPARTVQMILKTMGDRRTDPGPSPLAR
jgi:hypothetical protein